MYFIGQIFTSRKAHVQVMHREDTESSRQDPTVQYLWIWLVRVVSEWSPRSRYSGAHQQWVTGCVAFSILLSCRLCGSCFLFMQCQLLYFIPKQDTSFPFQRVGVIDLDKDNELSHTGFTEWLLSVSFTVWTPAVEKTSEAMCWSHRARGLLSGLISWIKKLSGSTSEALSREDKCIN